MVRSMTGYGKASADTGQKKLTVEVKSLNSKQLDINTRLPWSFKEKEIEIRNMISQALGRGKIDIAITIDNIDEGPVASINRPAVRSYFLQMKELATEIGITPDDSHIMQIVMRLPESVRSEKTEISEEEWNATRSLIGVAIAALDDYRLNEGRALDKDMRGAVANILSYLDEVVTYEGERIVRIRERIEAALAELGANTATDNNRFEQELIYYLEKLDINEEKVRLRKHCEYFLETLGVDNANGRTLSFIVQEMGREINTLGSKANHAAVQRLVVMMKEELEKIKEQALNVL
ncbi:MAG: YicC family protein [Bacteroidales bacterium]|nr:YicC family protein [Bacteroidales bacterium]